MAEAPTPVPTAEKAARNKFGTFGGVFTPSILTILGVIMFMRANFIVGQAGVRNAIIILVICKSITFLTSLSIGAISTNMRVRGGGAYFMISRVLGPEFGGAIGLALFAALALSVPFYIIGFTEAFVRSFPAMTPHFQIIAFAAASIFFVIAFVGAGWAIRTQYFIMAALILAICSFTIGQVQLFEWKQFWAAWDPLDLSAPNFVSVDPKLLDTIKPLGFWMLFAIYFPAVTGIDAGVNMSGDLKDPARSIPRGTLAAVGVGFFVYFLQTILAAGAYPRHMQILEPYQQLKDNALVPFLVAGGVFAATLSSALGSYLAAPRVLQAVSRDPILPILKPFGKGSIGGDEPRRALLLVGVITVAVLIWAGNPVAAKPDVPPATISAASAGTSTVTVDAAPPAAPAKAEEEPFDALNAVAAVVTMFFLFSYGTINFAAFIEAIGANPSFRPRFRYFHWMTALLGTFGCVAVALLVNAPAAVAAAVLIGGMIWFVRAQELESTFGDARRGFLYTAARNSLVSLSQMPEDGRNWRPTVLVFSGNPANREILVTYASWLEANRGIVFLANILVGDFFELAPRRPTAIRQLSDFCQEKGVHAFPVVIVSDTVEHGVHMSLQSAAIGPLKPNLVVFGLMSKTDAAGAERYFRQIRSATTLDMGAVLIQPRRLPDIHAPKRIDVWWRGQKNGQLMMLLTYLLTRNWAWDGSEVRVLRVVANEAGRAPAMEALQTTMDAARLEATAEAIVSERPFLEVLRLHSKDATCVFLGCEPPEDVVDAETWLQGLQAMATEMPTTIFVHSPQGRDMLV